MTKETIYYNRMFGYRNINYELNTKTIKNYNNEIKTYYYANFGNNRLEISEEEYNCLLKELEEKDDKN